MDDLKKNEGIKKFMRQLLTATCLTAASVGAAHGDTFTESTDFSDTFAAATALPAGTDVVTGQVFAPQSNDLFDFFQFSGLTPSEAFNVHFTSTLNNEVGGAVFNSSQVGFGSLGFNLIQPTDIGGIIPSDGKLVVEIFAQEGGPYTASFTTLSAVPEPATAPLAGLGMLAAGGVNWWRRRLKP